MNDLFIWFVLLVVYVFIVSLLILNELKKILKKLDVIAHDNQQIKTAQRASQKRERKIISKVNPIWEK